MDPSGLETLIVSGGHSGCAYGGFGNSRNL